MLLIKSIKKIYNSGENNIIALDISDLIIEKGEFISLVGPSGSGKSTFLNLISMVDIPSEGQILFGNDDLVNINRDKLNKYRRENIGYVFQNFNLLQHLTALENVILPMIPYKKKKEIKKLGEELLERVGLKERLNHFPSQLSGGEQQRVAIARALIANPKIVIGDEPTGNLDTKNRDEIVELFKEINSQGVTVIIATHDMEVAKQTGKVLYLRDGKIVREEVLENA